MKPSWVKRFLGAVAGRNVDKEFTKRLRQIQELPFVKLKARSNDMSTFDSYVQNALRNSRVGVPSEWDIPAAMQRSAGRMDLRQALEEGRQAVKAERMRTLKARLGFTGATALPAVGVAALSSGEPETPSAPPIKQASFLRRLQKLGVENDVNPAALTAGSIAGAAPIVQGLRSGAMSLPEAKGKRILSPEELQKMLRPGDILLTSKPGISSAFKPAIVALGGDPYGYHVENVISAPKRGAPTIVHSTPAAGGADRATEHLQKGEDVIVKRLKDQDAAKKMVRNLRQFASKEDVLEHMLGPYARAQMYDTGSAIRGGLKSFIPEPLQKLIPKGKNPLPGSTICSSLPGMACPTDLAPGVAKHEIMPHHLQHSPALETVGHYRAPRGRAMRVFEGALRATPWALRGALGLGLGYGAYKGIDALMD